jgi:signal transduction histidine kinase
LKRLAGILEERNRQLAELVEHLRATPISEDIGTVARGVVSAARSVTLNPTWTLAILGSADGTLAAAVYAGDDDEPSEVTDLHRWAAVSGEDLLRPRVSEGPWGRFVVVPLGFGAGAALHAVLLSPWEGRMQPSAAEMNLLQLLAEHAGVAIEHALLYAQLRARTEELNRMAAIQTDFLRGVTHDLQTPLTSIKAVAAELAGGRHKNPDAGDDLQTIVYQADRLRRMVSQLLVVSRLEVGSITPRQEVFRLEPLIERTWRALRADRPFHLRSAPDRFLVVADPDRVEQVLWALLDNAVKYSPDNSAISVEIGISDATPQGVVAEVAVVDHGAGMDSDTQMHAFDQFYRGVSARQNAPDGSGVGLYAARGLITAMGGAITLESGPHGTRIAFVLPAERVTSANAVATD